jgi:hypothetical protein
MPVTKEPPRLDLARCYTELQWISLLHQYLPARYRAAPAFAVDADGRRSDQIDIAVYDAFYSPLLIPHPAGPRVPAESVYAVFKVKKFLDPRHIRAAGRKAASVRCLRRTSVPFPGAAGPLPAKAPPPILAGLLAVGSGWVDGFKHGVCNCLHALAPDERLDLGCALLKGAFETSPLASTFQLDFSTPQESLVFFVIRLLDRLRQLGNPPAADYMAYARFCESFAPPVTGP